MQAKGYQRFSFLGRGSFSIDDKKPDVKEEALPSLKLQLDKDVYRPGDSVIAAIEIQNPNSGNGSSEMELAISDDYSILVEYITFELKGIEKLDTQWFTTQKPPPGSKQRRGYIFLLLLWFWFFLLNGFVGGFLCLICYTDLVGLFKIM